MPLYKVKLSSFYKKFLIIFLVACIGLGIFIIYVVFNQATVKIKPAQQSLSVNFPVNIIAGANEESAMSISGVVNDVIIDKEKEFTATGLRAAEGDVLGTVTIYNNYSQDQPLVATTRLLTPDNILLRLKDRVNVPAGGSVKADVYADDPGAFKEIKPTKLKIPGLWEGLQDLIYAESTTVIANQSGEIKFVQAKDIERAKDELKTEIYKQVADDFKDDDSQGVLAIGSEIIEEQISAEPEDIADSFTVKMKVKVHVVMFDKEKLYPIAGERLTAQMKPGFKLENIDLDNFSYTVKSFDSQKQTVSVDVHAEGNIKLDENGPILDKQKLMGLNEKGAELYLSSLPEIEWADVELSPFWVTKIPGFEDHIVIEIVE
ncbi:MAG: hypothetical protein ACOZBH_02915 [Patescibacteria group bacterium]